MFREKKVDGPILIWPLSVALAICVATPSLRANEFLYFSEDFTVDAANWAQSNFMETLTHRLDDGPNGLGDNYVSTDRNFAALAGGFGTPIIFRGQQNVNSSDQGYVGDWIDDKVVRVELLVRHNFDQPISFGGRFAGIDNTPGASFIGADVPQNEWTPITFLIDPDNVFDPINNPSGQIVTFGGGSFESVFDQISNIQISVAEPMGLTPLQRDQLITFDLDAVSITAIPEPTSLALISILGVLGSIWRHRHR